MNDPNYYAEEYNSIGKEPKKIRILDSTLREGEQHPGVSFTVKQEFRLPGNLITLVLIRLRYHQLFLMITLKQLKQLSSRDYERTL